MSKEKESGPLSSAGIMRFMDVSGGGPKVTPEVVLIISIAFIALVIVLNIL